jgi:hypothetical protein
VLASQRSDPCFLLTEREAIDAAELQQWEHERWLGICAMARSAVARHYFQPLLDVLTTTDERKARFVVGAAEREERAFLAAQAALWHASRDLVSATATARAASDRDEGPVRGVDPLQLLLVTFRQCESRGRIAVEQATAEAWGHVVKAGAAGRQDAEQKEHARKHRERCINYREERRQALISDLLGLHAQLSVPADEVQARQVVHRTALVSVESVERQELARAMMRLSYDTRFAALRREEQEWVLYITALANEDAQRLYIAKEELTRQLTLDGPWDTWATRSISWFTQECEVIATTKKRRISAARVLQWFYRRRRIGCAGWRASHRWLGAWVARYRERRRIDHEKADRRRELDVMYYKMGADHYADLLRRIDQWTIGA